MEEKMTISYNWNTPSGFDEIPENHKTILKDEAKNRIIHFLEGDFIQGELNTIICLSEDDKGTEYSGWWSVKYETIEK